VKRPKPCKTARVDDGDFGFGFVDPKPSLLNQLTPGQRFDPRQIDFSMLTLPNCHRSNKNKKTKTN
jgi:hypothetical protein